MLGVVNGAGQKWYEALATFLIVLVINVLLLLPDKIPDVEHWYQILKQAFLIAFTIYAVNKGIAWRRKE